MTGRKGSLTRDEKVKNLVLNHSMIFMGMFEEAFADLAEKMTEAMAKMAAASVDAMAGGPSPGSGKKADLESSKPADFISPEIRSQIGRLFSGLREEIAAQWPTDRVFEAYVANPAFDKGVQTVEGYDFGRPRLTEELSDEVLASYLFLLQSGDKELAKMFKELAEWQAALPKPPWRL